MRLNPPTQQTLNPNTNAAIPTFQLRKPAFSALDIPEQEKNTDRAVPTTEVDFSAVDQPFLDGEAYKKYKEKKQSAEIASTAKPPTKTEYGRMAIAERKKLSG